MRNAITKLSLPELLSAVLTHPDIPTPLLHDIEDAVMELFNRHVAREEIMAHQRSPEYLSMLIRGHHRLIKDSD